MRFLKAREACVTKAFRSARNSTRLTHRFSLSNWVSATTVRVFPVPVAMTSSALRRLSVSKASATARMASCW